MATVAVVAVEDRGDPSSIMRGIVIEAISPFNSVEEFRPERLRAGFDTCILTTLKPGVYGMTYMGTLEEVKARVETPTFQATKKGKHERI